MKNTNQDILDMMDTLGLTLSAQKFNEILNSPELGNYSAVQFVREILVPQYLETINHRFETNLRLSSLINKGALVENLKTGNGRIYNDTTVEQILTFRFAEQRQNVGVYGVTAAGKSYFLSACCVEACRLNFRCKFVDYCDLLDELIVLNRQEDLSRYRKRIGCPTLMFAIFTINLLISLFWTFCIIPSIITLRIPHTMQCLIINTSNVKI